MTGAMFMIGCGLAVGVMGAFADALTGFILHRVKKRADRMRRNG